MVWRGNQVAVPRYGFCLLNPSPHPHPRPHSWVWAWRVFFLPVSSQLCELVLWGAWSTAQRWEEQGCPQLQTQQCHSDYIFHTQRECRWFHNTECFWETTKGGIQLRLQHSTHVRSQSLPCLLVSLYLGPLPCEVWP